MSLVFGGAGVASFATVGILKRLKEEDIDVDSIVTSGWPTLFCLGYGFFKSVHDLEWFAMRLQEKDFYSSSIFDMNKGYASHEQLSQLIEKSFQQKDLSDSKIPIVIAATNTEQADSVDIYEKGDWREPLLKTMSIPGIYRAYPQSGGTDSVSALKGLEVEESIKRGSKFVVAVDMYTDYLLHLGPKTDGPDRLFRKIFASQLRASVSKQMKLAQLSDKIVLSKSPTDFAAKRAAIQMGYVEGARLAKEIRQALHIE